MMSDKVCDPVGQRPGFSTTSASNHQQRTYMVINSPSLGIIQAGEKAQEKNLGSTTRSKRGRFMSKR
jgi:hypothetical protein